VEEIRRALSLADSFPSERINRRAKRKRLSGLEIQKARTRNALKPDCNFPRLGLISR